MIRASIIENHIMFRKTVIRIRLVTDQISCKKTLFQFLLIMSVTFIVPSQCSFPKLHLHVIKKIEILFVALCLYFHQLKMSLSDFENSISN